MPHTIREDSRIHRTRHCIGQEHRDTLGHALRAISRSAAYGHISSIYLYGSLARGDQKNSSDIDLLLVIDQEADEALRQELRDLRAELSDPGKGFSETDIRYATGDTLRRSRSTFYQNVRKEGIEIWTRHRT